MLTGSRLGAPIAAAVALMVSVLSSPARSDDPVSSSVTFNREVIRILDRKCLPCHAPGAIAMSLATYHDARLWSRGIREELVEQRMPPWRAAPGYGVFANDIGLTARELTTILMWTDGGMPRGEDRDLPRPAATPAGAAPDRRLTLPVQHIPAGGEDIVRRVVLETADSAGRRIGRVELAPGNRRVLRAAFIYAVSADPDHTRQWIGGWTPWLPSIAPPDGASFLLPPGSKLEIALHYRGRDRALKDRSSLGLFFADREGPAAGQIVVRRDAAGAADGSGRREAVLRSDARVWAILPKSLPEAPSGSTSVDGDAPTDDSSLEVTARRPDGRVDVLLWVPHQRRGWPTPYILDVPVLLPADTRLTVVVSKPGSGQAAHGEMVTLAFTDGPPSGTRPKR